MRRRGLCGRSRPFHYETSQTANSNLQKCNKCVIVISVVIMDVMDGVMDDWEWMVASARDK